MDQKQKTIFQLDTPYTEVHWPLISPNDQETIYELLIRAFHTCSGSEKLQSAIRRLPGRHRAPCQTNLIEYQVQVQIHVVEPKRGLKRKLLTPIGHHRIAYMAPSKGKRKRKRKRLEAKSMDSNFGLEKDNLSPPAPELSSHLLIGLASITRHLEILTRNQRWKWTEDKSHTNLLRSSNEIDHDSLHNSEMKVRHLAAIFVCRSSQPSVLHSHLPQLVTTTSLTQPYLQQTRLVQLPQGCESGLSSSLGLSCASFVGIFEDAPHSKLLVDFVRDVVPIIEVPWLKEAQKAQYMPVKVNAILTTAPLLKSNQKRS